MLLGLGVEQGSYLEEVFCFVRLLFLFSRNLTHFKQFMTVERFQTWDPPIRDQWDGSSNQSPLPTENLSYFDRLVRLLETDSVEVKNLDVKLVCKPGGFANNKVHLLVLALRQIKRHLCWDAEIL